MKEALAFMLLVLSMRNGSAVVSLTKQFKTQWRLRRSRHFDGNGDNCRFERGLITRSSLFTSSDKKLCAKHQFLWRSLPPARRQAFPCDSRTDRTERSRRIEQNNDFVPRMGLVIHLAVSRRVNCTKSLFCWGSTPLQFAVFGKARTAALTQAHLCGGGRRDDVL